MMYIHIYIHIYNNYIYVLCWLCCTNVAICKINITVLRIVWLTGRMDCLYWRGVKGGSHIIDRGDKEVEWVASEGLNLRHTMCIDSVWDSFCLSVSCGQVFNEQRVRKCLSRQSEGRAPGQNQLVSCVPSHLQLHWSQGETCVTYKICYSWRWLEQPSIFCSVHALQINNR